MSIAVSESEDSDTNLLKETVENGMHKSKIFDETIENGMHKSNIFDETVENGIRKSKIFEETVEHGIQKSKMFEEEDHNTNENNVGCYDRFFRPCVVEFMASLLFVCLGCMSVQNPLGANIPLPSAVAVSLCHGFLAAALITIFGNVSGGHFNPAVTLGCVISRALNPLLGLFYFLSQIVGSIAGAFIARAILPKESYVAIAGGAHILTAVGPGKGIVCEMILTALLVFTVLHSFVNDRPKDSNLLGPIAVGFALTASLLAGIGITGGSVNPIRSFGPAVALSSISTDAWTHHYVYWVGPICGSIIASLFFILLTADAGKRCCLQTKK
ncbi:hypothetical protein LOTGIDRAFT_196256 [Lottia gigantea]|uniref:Aquaporin n=1 Tax=Lottia gigantea TaxID=225164 RepID=V3ZVR0_LOTGI|nr:hypothetical protein LOTGIDRAFT_196256 [Lottia gigantea]ESO85026.1 hypothetical protein LOTGIDRAFT_196256 [Lottia gigantea]